jgi:hypothetical protein
LGTEKKRICSAASVRPPTLQTFCKPWFHTPKESPSAPLENMSSPSPLANHSIPCVHASAHQQLFEVMRSRSQFANRLTTCPENYVQTGVDNICSSFSPSGSSHDTSNIQIPQSGIQQNSRARWSDCFGTNYVCSSATMHDMHALKQLYTFNRICPNTRNIS